ncbi:uncharacterized protein LOC132758901 [Ruditapes philippinarum]|uniref:uncharacterized protein LOC132758901 n=1 Tax=Ruditapes philippinarum TaxID=129788 RepID=UPI00295BA978|nr:uncharacterized protein LOC132758901 [Ruditapes philippinarum]
MTTLTAQYYDDMWLALRKIEFYEHQGTHIDAPLHFGNGRQSLEQIPPERLYGPGVVIDVRDKVKVNPDYAVTVDDIFEHEREHGKIPPNAIVNMNSGWANKYPGCTTSVRYRQRYRSKFLPLSWLESRSLARCFYRNDRLTFLEWTRLQPTQLSPRYIHATCTSNLTMSH